MLSITNEQKTSLEKYIRNLVKALETSNYWKEMKEDRYNRVKTFGPLLSKHGIKKMTRQEFEKLISNLWATNLFRNKKYLAERMISENGGLENILTNLYNLLYGSRDLASRYDQFISRTRRFGPSTVTEVMAIADPDRYGIWNDKPKVVLPYLGIKGDISKKAFKYKADGKDYVAALEVFQEIRQVMSKYMRNPNYLDVDLLFWYIFNEELGKPRGQEKRELRGEIEGLKKGKKQESKVRENISKVAPTKYSIKTHTDAQAVLARLGDLLGYDTYVPHEDQNKTSDLFKNKLKGMITLTDLPIFGPLRQMEKVKHIDVLWLRDGEFPEYGFEVEESTDVTKGLLRLYNVRHFKMVPVIVGPESKRAKFKREISADPFYRIKDEYRFISYPELAQLFTSAEKFYDLRRKLLGR